MQDIDSTDRISAAMTAPRTAQRLYQAFAEADAAGLAAVLAPDFTAHISEGMPLGVGGPVNGPEQVLVEVWGKVFETFETAPVPDEILPVAPDRVIALGYYRGKCRSTGTPYTAAFAHDVRVTDGKVASLVQITDTQRWHEALTGTS